MLDFTVEEFVEGSTPAEKFSAACRLLAAAIIPEDICPGCGGPLYNLRKVSTKDGIDTMWCYTSHHYVDIPSKPSN